MQSGPNRSKNSAASKKSLLQAATSLFGQRGFESTTLKDIGDRAGVDAALIARYFGSKADLYVASLVAEAQGYEAPSNLEGLDAIAEAVISLADLQGLGPVTQALVRSDTADGIRAAAQAHVSRRLVDPLVADMIRRGTDRPELRAQIAVSAILGINLGRGLGWFDELKTVPREELVELIADLLEHRQSESESVRSARIPLRYAERGSVRGFTDGPEAGPCS